MIYIAEYEAYPFHQGSGIYHSKGSGFSCHSPCTGFSGLWHGTPSIIWNIDKSSSFPPCVIVESLQVSKKVGVLAWLKTLLIGG